VHVSHRVLLVEDDYFVSLEIEHQLILAGFDVVGVATTAEEAVGIARGRHPELVIMDVRLSGPRNGIDAAIELMDEYGIHSIFATAHDDIGTRSRAARAEPLGWIQKPYVPAQLIEMINSVFGGL
jgi:two-component system, response regulator PdtaR